MREIEVGINNCKHVLWIDDQNQNKDWENKKIMEQALNKKNLNIRFILKTNT